MIDIPKGRYWDLSWSLVSGCTPCSPGCAHCWSAAMTHRFNFQWTKDGKPEFNGHITIRPERLSIPTNRRKPTVFAVWNDFYHEVVPDTFRDDAYRVMQEATQHTYLILTKRPENQLRYFNNGRLEWFSRGSHEHIYHGLTVCNQEEADEKIPIFLQVPGKKFLSIEPLLSQVDIAVTTYWDDSSAGVLGVILGGETGPGARPMQSDWVRSVRDQCAAAGVLFFFKSWGKHIPKDQKSISQINQNRFLDGRTHNNLPWHKTP